MSKREREQPPVHREGAASVVEALVEQLFDNLASVQRMTGSGFEGFCESRRCSGFTYPESYIIEHT